MEDGEGQILGNFQEWVVCNDMPILVVRLHHPHPLER